MNLPPQPAGPSTSTAVPVVPGLPPLPGFGPASSSAAPEVGSSRPSSPFPAWDKPLSSPQAAGSARPPAAAQRQSLLRRILRRLEDNRADGHEAEMTAAERKRKRAEDEASYALLKTVLNAIFVTTGLVLLLSVIVVIIYTTFGTQTGHHLAHVVSYCYVVLRQRPLALYSFDCQATAIRPRYDRSTLRPTCFGLLHRILSKLRGRPPNMPPPLQVDL